MRQSSSYFTEYVIWKLLWTSPDYLESDRITIEEKHPRPTFNLVIRKPY